MFVWVMRDVYFLWLNFKVSNFLSRLYHMDSQNFVKQAVAMDA